MKKPSYLDEQAELDQRRCATLRLIVVEDVRRLVVQVAIGKGWL